MLGRAIGTTPKTENPAYKKHPYTNKYTSKATEHHQKRSPDTLRTRY